MKLIFANGPLRRIHRSRQGDADRAYTLATFSLSSTSPSSAVLMAIKGKMDLSINIAVGSGIQIALFVAPLLVFLSYVIGPAPMNLVFTPFEIIAVVVSVIVVESVSHDGESHWMEGVLLLAVYVILAMAFYFRPG